jgi:AcrR family transcriptional regulator
VIHVTSGSAIFEWRHPSRLLEFGEETVKERIFRVSAELFASNGYTATGIQELSDAVGLGRGALYHHIRSKELLLYQIIITLLEDMQRRATDIADAPSGWEAKIHLLAGDLLKDLCERRAGWTVSLSETRALSAEHAREVVSARDGYEAIWQQVFASAAEVGELRDVSPILLRGVLGMLNSTHLWMVENGQTPPGDIARQYVDLLLSGLRLR